MSRYYRIFLEESTIPSTLWNNLVAYYTGDNTPNDSKGAYNGTLVNGATYGTGKINNGFSFDGVNDYVSVGNLLNFDGTTPFSISSWFKVDNVTFLSSKPILANTIGAPTYQGIELQVENDKLRVFLINSIATNNLIKFNGSTTLVPGIFYHVTLTYDGSKSISGCNLYLNGALETKSTTTDSLTGSIYPSLDTYIGTSQNFTLYQKGITDEIGCWAKVLTPAEVTELYNSGSGKQYPL